MLALRLEAVPPYPSLVLRRAASPEGAGRGVRLAAFSRSSESRRPGGVLSSKGGQSRHLPSLRLGASAPSSSSGQVCSQV